MMDRVKKWGKSEIIGAILILLVVLWGIIIAHSLLALPIVIVAIVLIILFLFMGKEAA